MSASQGKNAKTAAPAMPAVIIISSKVELNKRITALKTSAADLQFEMHVLACSVLVHLEKHRNLNVLTHFLDAIPDMVRVNSLKLWFETFGTVSFTPVTPDAKPEWRFDASKKVRLGDAMVKPFYKFKALEGAPYKPLVMDDYVNKQIAALEKDIKNVPYIGNLVMDPRKAILASFKSFQACTVVDH